MGGTESCDQKWRQTICNLEIVSLTSNISCLFFSLSNTKLTFSKLLTKKKRQKLDGVILFAWLSYFGNFRKLIQFCSFSNFFNPANPSPTSAGFAATTSGDSAAVPSIRYSANPTTPALEAMRRKARAQQNGDLVLMMDSDLSSERARAMKNLKAHVTRLSNGDRIQAYGWSITGQSSNR